MTRARSDRTRRDVGTEKICEYCSPVREVSLPSTNGSVIGLESVGEAEFISSLVLTEAVPFSACKQQPVRNESVREKNVGAKWNTVRIETRGVGQVRERV